MTGNFLTGVRISDRLFDQALSTEYNLSIRVYPDGLSFLVYSPLLARYVFFEDCRLDGVNHSALFSASGGLLAEAFSRKIENEPWLNTVFRKVHILMAASAYTLVPEALYKESARERYLSFVTNLSDNTLVLSQYVHTAEAWLVFAPDSQLTDACLHYFPDARIQHRSGALAESVLPGIKRNPGANQVLVFVRSELFDILVVKEGKLRYLNSFRWKTKEDLTYYLVFVLDQLSLNPENVPLILSGDIHPDSDLFGLLSRYVRHIRYSGNNNSQVLGILDGRSDHYTYPELLNPLLCE